MRIVFGPEHDLKRLPWLSVVFTSGAGCCRAFERVVMIAKGPSFPTLSDRVTGNVDDWGFVVDGGILLLLPFLLKKHEARSVAHCRHGFPWWPDSSRQELKITQEEHLPSAGNIADLTALPEDKSAR